MLSGNVAWDVITSPPEWDLVKEIPESALIISFVGKAYKDS
jgi:hypothetical protein